jgi:hypothetical protein
MFPVGASIEVFIVSIAPQNVLSEIQQEAENMSPTMMNWREELPFCYGVARRAKSTKHRVKPERVMKDGEPCGSGSPIGSTIESSCESSSGSSRGSSTGISRVMKFFWKLSTANGKRSIVCSMD